MLVLRINIYPFLIKFETSKRNYPKYSCFINKNTKYLFLTQIYELLKKTKKYIFVFLIKQKIVFRF